MALWVGLALLLMSIAAFAVGLVMYTNGRGVAPHQRTDSDPTGVRRATSRVEWTDVFRQMPHSISIFVNKDASREERLAAGGSFLVLIALIALVLAVLALVASLL